MPLSPCVTWFQGADEEDADPPPQQQPQNAQELSVPDEQEQPQIDQDASLPDEQQRAQNAHEASLPDEQKQPQRRAAPARKDGQSQAPRKSYGQANFLNDARTRLLYASKRYKGELLKVHSSRGLSARHLDGGESEVLVTGAGFDQLRDMAQTVTRPRLGRQSRGNVRRKSL